MTDTTHPSFFGSAGVLFDLDGVLTPTAELHMQAWAEMFNTLLKEHGDDRPYTDADYYRYLDGRKRYDGVAALLDSRDIALPFGDPADEASDETVCGVGNRKNVVFFRLLDAVGIAPYPGSLAVLNRLTDAGTPVAVVSSSKNAEAVLKAAGLFDRFRVIVDGAVAEREGIPSKPDPGMFLSAAEHLGIAPADSVVVEDAISGVEAGAAGGFGLVVGVDRGVSHEALLHAGATVVVSDLADLLDTQPGA